MRHLFSIGKLILVLSVVVFITGCNLSQQAGNVEPTATSVDVNSVMTAAAATAFVELTQIAAKPSETMVPTNTVEAPTNTPESPTEQVTPDAGLPTATEAAGGLPATPTTEAAAPTPVVPGLPSPTAVVPAATAIPGQACLNSKFVDDVTIPDGTTLKPNEQFTKVWRIQNTGICKWDQGYGLMLWAGPDMGGSAIYFSDNDDPVMPGGTVDLGIKMYAPGAAGDYIGHWVMVSDQGMQFGSDLTVVIKVK